MQKMYEDYGDKAEFRLVYIREAHASDSSWPVRYAKEKGITNHKNYGQRCQTAEMLLKDKHLTIPTIIDGMDNSVNKAYKAHPDRIYVVRSDGRLAVAGKRGPFGFKPALNAAKKWLAEFKKTGHEPDVIQPSEESLTQAKPAGPAPDAAGFKPVLGDWAMKTDFRGQQVASSMSLVDKEGKVYGTWTTSQGRKVDMNNLKMDGKTFHFERSMGGGMSLVFEGTVEGDKLVGKYVTPFGDLTCTGTRSHAAGAVQGG